MKKLTFNILSPRGHDTVVFDLDIETEKAKAVAEAERLMKMRYVPVLDSGTEKERIVRSSVDILEAEREVTWCVPLQGG